MNLSKLKTKPNILEGSIIKGMLLFAIPLSLSSVLSQFFNTADTMMVGRWGGATEEACEQALAAVGSCGSLINCIIYIFVGVGTGASVCVAQEIGARDDGGVRQTVRTAVTASMICGLLCAAVGFFGARPMLSLMGTDPAVLDAATVYMKAYFLGIPAYIMYNVCSSILTATGDSVRPLIFLSISGVLNVIFNAVMIIGFRLGVLGVGLATAISQWVALAAILWYMTRMPGDCRIPWRNLGIERKKLFRLLRIGIPAGFNGALFAFSGIVVQSAINSLGQAVIAGNVATTSIENYFAVVHISIASAGSVFIGQNIGAGNIKRVKQVIVRGTLLTAVVIAGLSFAALLFANALVGLFAPGNEEVITVGVLRAKIFFPPYFILSLSLFGANVLRGLGKNALPVWITVLWTCLFRIAWVEWIFKPFLSGSVVGIFTVFPISWVLATATLYVAILLVYRRWRCTQEEVGRECTVQNIHEPSPAGTVGD